MATNALASIGSDLSVSVSFQVASELVDASREVQMQDAELIGIVLGLSVAFSALLSLLSYRRAEQHQSFKARVTKQAEEEVMHEPDEAFAADGGRDAFVKRCVALEIKRFEEERSVTDFLILLVQISARISFSLTVQLLATSARSRQTSRTGRVLSLVGLSIFFTWIHAGSDKRIF